MGRFFVNNNMVEKIKKLRKSRLFNKKLVKYLVILAVIVVVASGLGRAVSRDESSGIKKTSVADAKAEQDINKEFSFPLKDSEGEEVSRLVYAIENAELRDEIIVKGQKATAVNGRAFLIFTIKITNEHNQSIEMNTRDYMRLSVNGNEDEWLAPDIHNDPVEIQAISTKSTRLGFPINDTDTNLVLRVGEVNGEKEVINLELK